MRFLLPAVAILGWAWTAFAADPVESGNLLAALEEKNPAARRSALLYTLEHTGKASASLLRVLDSELGKSVPDKNVLQYLREIWRKRPSDLYTAEFVLGRALQSRVAGTDLLLPVRNSLKGVELKSLSGEERQIFFRMLSFYERTLLKMFELPAAAEFYDTLIAKYPGDIQLASMAVGVYTLGCFRDTDTAPGMRNWEKLPAQNIWKKRLLVLQRNARRMVPETISGAMMYPALAIALHDSRSLKRAMEFYHDAPMHNAPFHFSLPYFGMLTKKPQWCRTAPMEIRPVLLAAAGDIDGAENSLADVVPAKRQELLLVVALYKRDFRKIKEIITQGYLPQSREGYAALCSAAEKLQDSSLLQKVIPALPADFARQKAVEANALGYTCAVLGYDLAQAEKLLHGALTADPENYAFLDSCSWLLFQQKKYSSAREYIGKALKYREADPSVAVVFLHAAAIELAATGDKIAAGSYLERAEKLRTPEVLDYDEKLAEKLQKELQ